VSGGTKIEAPKHRGANDAEWGGVWGGVSAPQPTRGLGERRYLPGAPAPAAIAFSAHFRPQNTSRSKKNTILLPKVQEKLVFVIFHYEKSGSDSHHHFQKLRLCAN